MSTSRASFLYERLSSLETVGVKLGLENIKTLLQALRNPESSFFSILIAGTNGKGSVGAMLEIILRRHGFRTGHYSSPHLLDVCERIRVNGNVIPRLDFESHLSLVFQTVDYLLKEGVLQNTPTYFETLTALSFSYFRQTKVEFAVVEVGLGGRFDATNAISQSLSVITSIDFDHEEFLGKTLSEIAAEKAGILKQNSIVVTGKLPAEAMQIVSRVAQDRKCILRSLDDSDLSRLRLENGFPVFEYRPWGESFRVNLRGRHQAGNAALALLTCDELRKMDIPIHRHTAQQALNEVFWPGRLEMLPAAPPILLDCAHNPMGARSLAQFMEDMRWEKTVFLFTAMKDKQIPPMLAAVWKHVDRIILTRVEPHARCAALAYLTDASAGLNSVAEEDTQLAFARAREYSQKAGLPLVVFGSIYLIGKILRILQPERLGDPPT